MKVDARILSYAISNGALAQTELPRSLKFCDWGDMSGVGGARVRVSALTATELPKRQIAKGWDRIALDYEHNTLKGTPEFERSQEPRAVAAYGAVRVAPGEGLFLDDLIWTPHGEKFAREYCDLSPAPLRMDDGTIVGVHSVALCRHGAIDGLSFYSVELADKETKMERFKWLLKFIGKGDEAKEEDLEPAFREKLVALCAEAVKTGLAELKAKVDALSAGPAGEKITGLSAELATLKGQVATFSAAIESRDRADILAQAAREGKVVGLSSEAVAKLSLKDLADHVKGLAVTVPLDQRTPSRIQAPSLEIVALSAEDVAVAKSCGFTANQVAKANGLKLAGLAAMVGLLFATFAQATALTAGRNTPQRIGPGDLGLTMGSNVIYEGSMVALTAGVAVAACDVANHTVVGCAMETVDNTGANYLSTRVIRVRRGIFRWANGPTFTDSSVGQLCYVSDDNTVTSAGVASADIIAGVIVDVDADGVWVDTYGTPSSGAASVTTLNASGNGAIGGTLTVNGNSTLSGTLRVVGAQTNAAALNLGSTLTADGAAVLRGTLAVTGAQTNAAALNLGSTLTVDGAVSGNSTVAATGFKIGSVSGYSGWVTNVSSLCTNIIKFYGGVVTNATLNP